MNVDVGVENASRVDLSSDIAGMDPVALGFAMKPPPCTLPDFVSPRGKPRKDRHLSSPLTPINTTPTINVAHNCVDVHIFTRNYKS